MTRYFIEMEENEHRIPKGKREGYASLAEAQEAAEKHLDDALPYNTVRILLHIATAYWAGDGSTVTRAVP